MFLPFFNFLQEKCRFDQQLNRRKEPWTERMTTTQSLTHSAAVYHKAGCLFCLQQCNVAKDSKLPSFLSYMKSKIGSCSLEFES